MSSDSSNNSSDDEGSDVLSNIDEYSWSSSEEEEKWEPFSEADLDLVRAITRNDSKCAHQALRNGANVNCNSSGAHHGIPCLTLAYLDSIRLSAFFWTRVRMYGGEIAPVGLLCGRPLQEETCQSSKCCSITTRISWK